MKNMFKIFKMIRFRSVKFKIRILFTSVLGIILILYSVYIYIRLRITLYEELDNELRIKSQEIATAINALYGRYSEGGADLLSNVREAIIFEDLPDPYKLDLLQEQWLWKVGTLNLKENYIAFLNTKGETLVKSKNLKSVLYKPDSKALSDLKAGYPIYTNNKKRDLRTISFPYVFLDDERYIIQVGASVKPIMRILRVRLFHILASIPVILLITVFFSKIFTARLLKPVYEIANLASKITDENLSVRVDGSQADEEMGYLVDAFNSMISRLEKSFKGISDFSSQVAHELKTSLTIIRGESDVALRKERVKKEYKNTINNIREESERMLRTIEDILLLTKLDFPVKAINFERFDIVELLKEVYNQYRLLAVKQGKKIIMENTQKPHRIKASKLHLRRLFMNLIDNAIKYTNRGGKIHIQAAQKHRRIIVSISDTGIGIAREELPKIFYRFYRTEHSQRKRTSGTGLGLSIVKSIVDSHHGTIDVASKLGKGSTFTVVLPSE